MHNRILSGLLQDNNHPQSTKAQQRTLVGTPGTELQAESNLLYLSTERDSEYIGEDQLDVLLKNARATRQGDHLTHRDYRGMS